MKIGFQSLTPLWTGDRDKRGDRLRAAGLIGSSRYWYWVMKRLNNSEQNANLLTDFLFGTTGWGRPFRFRLLQAEMMDRLPCAERFRFRQRAFLWRGSFEISLPRSPDTPVKGFTDGAQIESTGFQHLLEEAINRHNGFGSYVLNETSQMFAFIKRHGFWGIGGQNGLGIVQLAGPLPELSLLSAPEVFASTELQFPGDFQISKDVEKLTLPTLLSYFSRKVDDARGRLEQALQNRDRQAQQWRTRLQNREGSYKALSELHRNRPSGPYIEIAYELRRWLRMQLGDRHDDVRFGRGGRDAQAGIVYVSHPYRASGHDYQVRITVAARPGLHTNVSCQKILDQIIEKLNWEKIS